MIGLSQEKLGERLGVTFQQIQKYEKGTNRIGSGRLQEIANVLGVPISFFFEDQPGAGGAAGQAQPSSPLGDLLAGKDSLQLLQAYNAISDQTMRRAILNLALAAAGQAPAPEPAQRSRPSVR